MANNQACFPITAEAEADGKVVHALNQLTKVRLADGREVAIIDWTWRPLYSTVDTLTSWTDLELRAFTYSVGDPITVSGNMTVRETASLMHTNIKTPAEMDSQEEMLVYAIRVEMYRMIQDTEAGTIDADQAFQPVPAQWHILLLHQACIGELEVSQKEYQQASLGMFVPGFGVIDAGSRLGEGAALGQNSVPSAEAMEMFPVPVHIGSTEKYAFIVHNPQGLPIVYRDQAAAQITNAVMRLRINLHGLHKRPAG